MSRPSPSLTASYAYCRRVVRQPIEFFAVFSVASSPETPGDGGLYAFMRQTDDLADNPCPAVERREALCRWRAALDAALAGTDGGNGSSLWPALADTVHTFKIPEEHLHAVIDGVEMDLASPHYETFDELAEYCRRVASAVGLACLYVWGFHGDEALPLAHQCGVAFQLTNILRDLKEDAQQGRVYLPRRISWRAIIRPRIWPGALWTRGSSV